MGAWPTMALRLPEVLGRTVRVISLPPSSAPAPGTALKHSAEHRDVIETALGKGWVYFTDRGIEELAERRGDEQVSLGWLAERLREFTDLTPEYEAAVDRLATWLARLDDEDDEFEEQAAPPAGKPTPGAG